VAELTCGHNQHVRHRPPFQIRTWVLEEDTRAERVGTELSCPSCSRSEVPVSLRFVRSSPEWTEETVPPALLRAHQVGHGTWGLLRVHSGNLRFVQLAERNHDVVLGLGSVHAIPPDTPHRIVLLGAVRFTIDFLTVDRSEAPYVPAIGEGRERRPSKLSLADEGGETACWSQLVCAGCGVVLDEDPHRLDCRGA
jgi:tellurite methyltransferase